MADVAKAAGVSMPVVSAILKVSDKNNSRFSSATMKKVQKVARELNYRPHRAARKFAKDEKSTIGLLVEHAGSIRPQILTFIVEWADQYDLEIILEKMKQTEHPRFLRENIVDGIITFNRLPDQISEEIEQLNIPIVVVNARGGGPSACHIYFDEAGGMRKILEYFKSQGKQHPMLFENAEGWHYAWEARRNTFLEVCPGLGIADPRIIELNVKNPASGGIRIYEQTLKALQQYPKTDAVIVDWDHDAVCVYEAARQLGKRIPDDLSVVSISSERPTLFERMNPPLSSLKLNSVGIAKQAILLMLDLFAGKKIKQKDICSPYKLNIRGS